MSGILLSLLSGGGTGLLGTLVSGLLKYKTVKQQNDHEQAMTRLETEQIRVEAEKAERIAQIQADAAEAQAESEEFKASFKDAMTRLSTGNHKALIWIDVVRGLMRPVLTLGLVTLVGFIYFTSSDIANSEDIAKAVNFCGHPSDFDTAKSYQECINSKLIQSTQLLIINTVLYLATAAVLWWFGSRQVEKAMKR